MEIYINELKIIATNVELEKLSKEANERLILKFDFKVRSDESHRVTTELYKNDFIVKVPEKDLEFSATINNYSTSITDLYIEGAVADFKLELIEKPNQIRRC